MPNFKAEILACAGDEPIEAVVIGVHGDSRWSEEEKPPYEGKIISWGEAGPILDYEHKGGFGGCDSHSFWAWTKSRVIFLKEYDGANGPEWLPRNPVDGMPEYI